MLSFLALALATQITPAHDLGLILDQARAELAETLEASLEVRSYLTSATAAAALEEPPVVPELADLAEQIGAFNDYVFLHIQVSDALQEAVMHGVAPDPDVSEVAKEIVYAGLGDTYSFGVSPLTASPAATGGILATGTGASATITALAMFPLTLAPQDHSDLEPSLQAALAPFNVAPLDGYVVYVETNAGPPFYGIGGGNDTGIWILPLAAGGQHILDPATMAAVTWLSHEDSNFDALALISSLKPPFEPPQITTPDSGKPGAPAVQAPTWEQVQACVMEAAMEYRAQMILQRATRDFTITNETAGIVAALTTMMDAHSDMLARYMVGGDSAMGAFLNLEIWAEYVSGSLKVALGNYKAGLENADTNFANAHMNLRADLLEAIEPCIAGYPGGPALYEAIATATLDPGFGTS